MCLIKCFFLYFQNFVGIISACYAARGRSRGPGNMYKGELALLLTWSLAVHQGLCGELEKVAHQPSNVLVDFTAYRHISIVHFSVPENTISALFKYDRL